MALAAGHRDVSRMVLRQGLLLATAGVTLGLGGAFGLTRLMSSLLFGVDPVDPVTYAAVSALLALVALIATYVPARRVAGLNPVEALRWE